MSLEKYLVFSESENKKTILKNDLTFDEAIVYLMKNKQAYNNINIEEEKILKDKTENFVVISDCRNQLKETKELLFRPAKLNESFVFLGNFLGSENGFLDFLDYILLLSKSEDCVFVRGVNEHNILNYIHNDNHPIGNPSEYISFINNINKQLPFRLESLPIKKPEAYQLLCETVSFYENDKHIFVSGGLNLNIDNWKDSSATEFFTTTQSFLETPNETGKTVVFGNMPVVDLLDDRSRIVKPWYNKMRTKIGINGSCYDNGKLLGMFVQESDFCFMGIRKNRRL